MIRSTTFRAFARGVRATLRPAALFTEEQPARRLAPVPAPVADDQPPAAPTSAEVEQAAKVYSRASDAARRADREKRAAKKILDRVTAGLYGVWRVERVTSSRQVADLEAIRATYKRLGLGPVPMRTAAPSLKITLAEDAGQPEKAAA